MRLKDSSARHHIAKLLQCHTLVQAVAPVRFSNHVPEQLVPDVVFLFQVPRNPAQMLQCNRSVRALGEQTIRGVNFGGQRVVAAHVQLCGGHGDKRFVRDEAGGCRIHGGNDRGEFRC